MKLPLSNEALDLKGEVCPFTFVKTKLKLETMEIGEILDVTVDNSESAANVPRSLELEGQEVLVVEKVKGTVDWHILVTKKV
ncbi:MAG: sulfurtransferase TusA family protein [Spirochaetales bacterium]|jgi:tRNA 2-thiouridine synthesizing protein A|nr:sulfurtransferase TusA family protein [Spirochaetales bacterium]